MVEPTIDKIKDITVERQIRKLAGVIDEQNQIIETYGDATTDINNLKTSDANQNTEINKLKATSATHTTDIDNLKASDTNQTTQINNLKQSVATDKLATESAIAALQSKDAEQDGTLTNHATLIQGITESLVSDVKIMSGTTTGEIKVRLERESAAAIDSNNYNLGLPVSAEIIQGTGPSMFKVQITMSTGVKVISNDFVFTTEAIGNDVYISSFTFKAGNQDGYLSADIGLNNGVTIEANNFLVPTDPNVTSAITDLQSRLTTVENETTDISTLKTTVNEHTNAINTLNGDVANLTTDKADINNSSQTITAGTINANNINKGGVAVATVNNIPDISGKADLNNSSQTIIAGTINATNINKNGVSVATTNDIPDISGKVNIAQGTDNAGKVLGINDNGNVEPITVSSGTNIPNPVCYMKMTDYFRFNNSANTTTLNKFYNILDEVVDLNVNFPDDNQKYNCKYWRFITNDSVTLTRNYNGYVKYNEDKNLQFVRDVINKLNVDISSLPNGTYVLTLSGFIQNFVYSGYEFNITITNGVIESQTSSGAIQFPGDANTNICGICINNFRRKV